MLRGVKDSRLVLSLFVVLSLGAVVTALSSLAFPYTMRDSPTTTLMGSAIVEGATLYRDAWDSRAPGVHFIYAVKILLFGKGILGLRVFDLLWQGLTAGMIFLLARREKNDARAGALAALLYLILYYGQGPATWVQPDSFLILPLASSVLLALRAKENDRLRDWALAAALLAVAALIKLPFGVLGIAYLFLATSRPFYLPVTARRAAALAAGFAGPFLLMALYFYWKGGLRDLYYTQFVIDLAYVAKGTAGAGVPLSHALQRRESFPIYFLLVAAVAMCRDKLAGERMRRSICLLWLWAALAALVFLAHGLHYAYHLHPLLPPLIILASVHFFEMGELASSPWGIRRVAALALLASLSISPMLWLRQNLWFVRPALKNWENRDMWMVPARYLRDHSSAADTIYAVGGLPILYVDSDRRPACPIISTSFFPLSTPEYDLRQRCMAAILRRPPKFIVLNSERPDPAGPSSGEMVMKAFPQLKEYWQAHYTLDRDFEFCIIYRHND